MHKLFGSQGCGSAVVEAVLELLSVPYEMEMLEWGKASEWEALKRINPLGQVPTLVTQDGQVLTESAAIVLWLLAAHRGNALLPPHGSSALAALYHWMVFIPANIYAAITVGDFPGRWVEGEAAQASLKEKSTARVQDCWRMMEAAVAPSPYLLGGAMTALDVYVAMVSRWRPGRAWFETNCPRMAGAVKLTEQHPVIEKVWARNFG